MSDFSNEEQAAVYRAIRARRDVRAHFLPVPIDEPLLTRVLGAAHMAPSVGLSQPWRFIVIKDRAMRERVYTAFLEENLRAAEQYEGEKAQAYRRLRLEGIRTAPVNICVVSESAPSRGHGLGRRSMPETAKYSTVCAVQNLWLAARVEGLGLGWVSIIDPQYLRTLFEIPEEFEIVAYLCLGQTTGFAGEPELATAGWESRLPLQEVIFNEMFGRR